MVNFDPSRDDQAQEHLDALWSRLSDGGQVLMPLDAYSFSPHYGWVRDRYGLTWQLILTNPLGEPRPFIVPSLLFAGDQENRAEEAIRYYVATFQNLQEGSDPSASQDPQQVTRVGNLARYTEQTGPAQAGSLMFGECQLANQWFAAMDSGVAQPFTFNEAVSFVFCQRKIPFVINKIPYSNQGISLF